MKAAVAWVKAQPKEVLQALAIYGLCCFALGLLL